MTLATTVKRSVTVRDDLNREVEARSGKGGYSAYVNRALTTQLELDRLGELVAGWEADMGPVPDDVMRQVYADIDAANLASGYPQ